MSALSFLVPYFFLNSRRKFFLGLVGLSPHICNPALTMIFCILGSFQISSADTGTSLRSGSTGSIVEPDMATIGNALKAAFNLDSDTEMRF